MRPLSVPSDVELRRYSGLLAHASLLLAILLPSGVLFVWVDAPEEMVRRSGLPPETHLAVWQLVLGAFVTLIPVGLLSAALLSARRCFLLFRSGTYLVAAVVFALRAFGGRVGMASCASVLAPPVLSLLLSVGSPPGSRALTFSLSSSTLLGLLVGGTLWALAAVRARAVALAEENAQFV